MPHPAGGRQICGHRHVLSPNPPAMINAATARITKRKNGLHDGAAGVAQSTWSSDYRGRQAPLRSLWPSSMTRTLLFWQPLRTDPVRNLLSLPHGTREWPEESFRFRNSKIILEVAGAKFHLAGSPAIARPVFYTRPSAADFQGSE